jgi:elongation of very long chain fatty acids protein 6
MSTTEVKGFGQSQYPGYVFPFERHFDVVPTTTFLQTYYWESVISISVVYLTLIWIGQKWMENRPAFQLQRSLRLWNLGLAAFSAFGAWRHSLELYHVLKHFGFMGSACTVSVADSYVAYWGEKFAFSKVFELVDTAFLVLRKRPVTFLHWYHHLTVLAYTWHAVKDHTIAGRWFIWMNFSVHSIMYTYYAIASTGRRMPRAVSISVTCLQILQMVVGCFCTYFTYTVKSSGQYCYQTWENLYFCFVMYFTYFLLFLRYFHLAYISKDGRRKRIAGTEMQNGKAHLNGKIE